MLGSKEGWRWEREHLPLWCTLPTTTSGVFATGDWDASGCSGIPHVLPATASVCGSGIVNCPVQLHCGFMDIHFSSVSIAAVEELLR